MLMFTQKAKSAAVFATYLHWIEVEQNAFLDRIVTVSIYGCAT
jgi:hypothetical protein